MYTHLPDPELTERSEYVEESVSTPHNTLDGSDDRGMVNRGKCHGQGRMVPCKGLALYGAWLIIWRLFTGGDLEQTSVAALSHNGVYSLNRFIEFDTYDRI